MKQGAEIGLGLEGGVMEMADGMYLCNWGAVADSEGNIFSAAGARILLPNDVVQGLKQGKELGTLMGELTNDPEIRKKMERLVFSRVACCLEVRCFCI